MPPASARRPAPARRLIPALWLVVVGATAGCGIIDAAAPDLLPLGPPIVGDPCENSPDFCLPELTELVCEEDDQEEFVCTSIYEASWPACPEAAERLEGLGLEQVSEVIVFDAVASSDEGNLLEQRCIEGELEVYFVNPERSLPVDLSDNSEVVLELTSDVAPARAGELTATGLESGDELYQTITFQRCWSGLAADLDPPEEFAVALLADGSRSNIICVEVD